MKTRMVLVAVAVLFGFSLQLAARADTISYVGTQFDTGAGWRTASTNNVYSAGGNTYYGTDGYYAFAMQLFGNNSGNFNPGSAPSGIQDVVAPPAFVTSSGFAPGVQEAGGYNYRLHRQSSHNAGRFADHCEVRHYHHRKWSEVFVHRKRDGFVVPVWGLWSMALISAVFRWRSEPYRRKQPGCDPHDLRNRRPDLERYPGSGLLQRQRRA